MLEIQDQPLDFGKSSITKKEATEITLFDVLFGESTYQLLFSGSDVVDYVWAKGNWRNTHILAAKHVRYYMFENSEHKPINEKTKQKKHL